MKEDKTIEMSIGTNQIDLWQAFPQQLKDEAVIDKLKQLLTEEELYDISKLKRSNEQHTKLIARAFLRNVLSRYTNIPANELIFKRSLHGKPEIANEGVNLSFNLSHSGDIIVCAVAKYLNIGVDVEKIRYKVSLTKENDFIFNPIESSDMSTFIGVDKQRRFFDYWTLKESFVKALGAGLTFPLNKVSFVPGKTKAAIFFDNLSLLEKDDWQSWLWPLDRQHRMALTIDKNIDAPTGFRTFCFSLVP